MFHPKCINLLEKHIEFYQKMIFFNILEEGTNMMINACNTVTVRDIRNRMSRRKWLVIRMH